MSEGVRTQNLRDFTVQIRNAADQIVGTGIAVSMDGKVVTCRHVVEAAIYGTRKTMTDAEIGVYFQFAAAGEKKERVATVEKFFEQSDDDIVLLRLKDCLSPLAPEQLPKLGDARDSAGHKFTSFGYRRLSNYQGLPARGEIIDFAPAPDGATLLCEPVMLECQHIDGGMSGAAVLDLERNLVVGVVAETYESAGREKDRDTAFAIDNRILTFSPFDFSLEDKPFPLKAAPEPKFDRGQAEAAVFIKEKYSWNNAPTVLPEWTGRDELLAQITSDWNDPHKHVTGLIGFGGEGKSSLARAWVESLMTSNVESQRSQPSDVRPSTFDGLFWWGFYENRSVDEFLEAALNYLSGGRIDPRQIPSSSLRAQIIGAMLGTGRYLFVLDGFEVMQHQDGDQYGLVTSNDLRDLLTYFARPDNQSFCLVTSRAPLLDLMDYTTYTHRDVDRLSEADGVALLKKLGVKPSPDAGRGQGEGELAKVIHDWDGHALTVSLLGSYLAEKHGGDLAHLAELPIPIADEPRYERVHRVLRRYDEHLTPQEREFLKLFSAFRTPVHEDAFGKVFQPLLSSFIFPDKERGKTKEVILAEMVARLVTYRLLKHDPASHTYTAHPLVRNHYLSILTHDPSAGSGQAAATDVHIKIKDYYLSIAGDTPQFPTLDNLKPLIEVVHHACQAGAYDEAHRITYDHIYQGYPARTLVNKLGAWETAYTLMLEFLPKDDTFQEPQVSNADGKRWILNEIGLCLMSLGRLREAVPFYERKNKIALEMQDWHNLSNGYRNLADLHATLGALEQSAAAARQALDLARRAESKRDERTSLAFQGLAAHLRGNLQIAGEAFAQAEKLEQEIDTDIRYLYSLRGINHADRLRRTAVSTGSTQAAAYARRVIEANLQICEKAHWPDDLSRCHRVLGDLDADAGNHTFAREHYETALKLARGISYRAVLIEALLARGRWAAKARAGLSRQNDGQTGMPDPPLQQAFNDLNEALDYAVEGGYRIYEADLRVALAWAWVAVSHQPSDISAQQKAKAEAERALQMSQEMGYYWGKLDAEEVLARILSL